MLKTVSEIIDAFGGTSQFARTFNKPPPHVSKARRENRVPFKWRIEVWQETERRAIAVDPALFGIHAEQSAAKALGP